MLKDIFLSNTTQTCAIIEDDNTVKGTDLFRAALKHDIQNNAVKEVHLITCENPPDCFPEAVNDPKVIIYNVFQDPNCWLQKNDSHCDKIVDRVLTHKEYSSSIMIDSLHFLSEISVFAIIHRLKKNFKKVICLLHRDEITCSETINNFMYLSNVYLQVYKYNPNPKISGEKEVKRKKLVEGIYVKPSGKIAKFKEIVLIDENLHLHGEVYKEINCNTGLCKIKDDFKNITTFRLGLDIKENEKIARDNLVLPYLRSSEAVMRTNSEEGQIIYYAEAGDDSEEDPDDDLDI